MNLKKYGKGTEAIEATPEQKMKMLMAEQEVQQRAFLEYREKIEKEPDTQVALDNRLLRIDARLSTKRELLPIMKMPDGSIRDAAVELDEDYPEIFTEDMIKGNYGDSDIECLWGNGVLINYLSSLGKTRDVDLKPACRFFKANMDLFTNISRGKGMASAILTKTDKHVSEGVIQHVQQALIEKRKKTWGFF